MKNNKPRSTVGKGMNLKTSIHKPVKGKGSYNRKRINKKENEE